MVHVDTILPVIWTDNNQVVAEDAIVSSVICLQALAAHNIVDNVIERASIVVIDALARSVVCYDEVCSD